MGGGYHVWFWGQVCKEKNERGPSFWTEGGGGFTLGGGRETGAGDEGQQMEAKVKLGTSGRIVKRVIVFCSSGVLKKCVGILSLKGEVSAECRGA